MVTHAQRHKLDRSPISDPHVILLEFWEDAENSIERAAINNEEIIHLGETYYPVNMEVNLPSSENDEVGASLSASNVERILGRALDRAKRRITVRMKLIDTAFPDVVIMDTYDFLVIESASLGGVSIEAQLAAATSLIEPFNDSRTTKQQFPGVWLP